MRIFFIERTTSTAGTPVKPTDPTVTFRSASFELLIRSRDRSDCWISFLKIACIVGYIDLGFQVQADLYSHFCFKIPLNLSRSQTSMKKRTKLQERSPASQEKNTQLIQCEIYEYFPLFGGQFSPSCIRILIHVTDLIVSWVSQVPDPDLIDLIEYGTNLLYKRLFCQWAVRWFILLFQHWGYWGRWGGW